jgi:ABC-type transport system involved in cytochrome bd biosynthesis fused ATPase/permease subunit
MEGIKKIVNVLVMLYLVAGTLIYFKILNVGQDTTPGFYTTFFVVGGILMLLELIVENLYIMTLKRGHMHNQQKINDLKASLYDHKQEIQDLRTQQAESASSAAAAKAARATSYTTATAPITAAPTGTEPVPPVVKPVERTDNPHVIITPSPTPGIQDPERRLPENSDT